MARGGFKVEGADQLKVLAAELKVADRALLLAMRRNIRAAAKPAGPAVQAHEREVLPKTGGLNEWIASTPVGTRILTGPRSAGVRLVQSKKGRAKPHDLAKLNETGEIRHPVYGRWVAGMPSQTGLPTHFWEEPLLAMEPQVAAAMRLVMDETARAAGFR